MKKAFLVPAMTAIESVKDNQLPDKLGYALYRNYEIFQKEVRRIDKYKHAELAKVPGFSKYIAEVQEFQTRVSQGDPELASNEQREEAGKLINDKYADVVNAAKAREAAIDNTIMNENILVYNFDPSLLEQVTGGISIAQIATLSGIVSPMGDDEDLEVQAEEMNDSEVQESAE